MTGSLLSTGTGFLQPRIRVLYCSEMFSLQNTSSITVIKTINTGHDVVPYPRGLLRSFRFPFRWSVLLFCIVDNTILCLCILEALGGGAKVEV